MVRDYLVLDEKGNGIVHWNTDREDDWAEFLDYCRKSIDNGRLTTKGKVVIDGVKTMKLEELL